MMPASSSSSSAALSSSLSSPVWTAPTNPPQMSRDAKTNAIQIYLAMRLKSRAEPSRAEATRTELAAAAALGSACRGLQSRCWSETQCLLSSALLSSPLWTTAGAEAEPSPAEWPGDVAAARPRHRALLRCRSVCSGGGGGGASSLGAQRNTVKPAPASLDALWARAQGWGGLHIRPSK